MEMLLNAGIPILAVAAAVWYLYRHIKSMADPEKPGCNGCGGCQGTCPPAGGQNSPFPIDRTPVDKRKKPS